MTPQALAPESPPVFYSALLAALVRGQGAPRSASAEQWRGWLDGAQRRGEFRQAERDWIGLDDWLATQEGLGGKSPLVDLLAGGHMLSASERRRIAEDPGLVSGGGVTREQVAAYVERHQVRIGEVMLGGPRSYEQFVARMERKYGSGWRSSINDHEIVELERLPPEHETDTRYAKYQLIGGSDYRELLLTLPPARRKARADVVARDGTILHKADSREVATVWLEAHRGMPAAAKAAVVERNFGQPSAPEFLSGHWDEPNVLVHVRFNARTDAEGQRVLFIEEIQSDWHQTGRRHGYASESEPRPVEDIIADLDAVLNQLRERTGAYCPDDEDWADNPSLNARFEALSCELRVARAAHKNDSEVPDAPFKASDEWAMLAFKRIVRHAAEQGFDRIGWTTGARQADRYDLSTKLHSIAYTPLANGNFDIQARAKGSGGPGAEPFWAQENANLAQVEEYLGKELAEKIAGGGGFRNGNALYLEGLDLKVGGQGMVGFYDKILPKAVNRWAKKFGSEVTSIQVDVSEADSDRFEVVLGNGKVVQQTGTRKHAEATAACFKGARVVVIDHSEFVHGLVVTAAMRDAALQGLPMFKRELGDEVGVDEQEEDDGRPAFRF